MKCRQERKGGKKKGKRAPVARPSSSLFPGRIRKGRRVVRRCGGGEGKKKKKRIGAPKVKFLAILKRRGE